MRTKLTEKSLAALQLPAGKSQDVYWDVDRKSPRGFGVVVGKQARTFILDRRVNGKKERTKIGIAGDVREDGHHWSLELARQRAEELCGTVAAGGSLSNERIATKEPTLRQGMKAHLERMKAKGRAERSIQTFEWEMLKHLHAWLDRPINDVDLAAIQKSIKANTAKREGTNPRMPTGSYVANRVIAHVSASWRSLNRVLKGKLGNWNPANSVDKTKYVPKRERIEDLPDWAKRVATMRSPIRRDGLMFTLYTALRHEDVRSVRFDDVDFEASTLRLPDPKGGEAAAFTIPLCASALELLKRRKQDNARDIGNLDGGWCFPALDAKGKVGPISDLRQSSRLRGGRFPVEDVHSLRREWESIAAESGISEIDQHVLTNHSFANHNVNASYISQHINHLATCAAKMDDAIGKRLRGDQKAHANRAA